MKNILLLVALFASAITAELYAGSSSAVSSHVATADDGHGHTADELPEFKYNKFAGNYEVYLGIQSLVLNKDVHFHVNITDLNTYKPVVGAKAIVTIGGLSTPEKTTQNGILHFGFKPTKQGIQNIDVALMIDGEKYVVNMGEIMVFAGVSEAAHGPKPDEENKINLAKTWMWDNLFGVEEVKEAPFNKVIRTRGEIVPSTNGNSFIVAPSNGKVNFINNIIPGKQLYGKQTIAYINSKGLEDNIKARYAKMEAEYESTMSEYERNVILAKDLIVSQQVLRDSYTRYVSAKENFMSLKELYSEQGIKVMAYNTSTVVEVLVTENQFVTAGEPIARVQLEKGNLLKVEVSKYNYDEIDNIVDANFIPEYRKEALNVKKLKGSIIPTNIATAQNSAYIPIYFTIPIHKDVIANSYAEVYAIVSSKTDVISIPNEAIAENEGLYWVYVQTNGEQFEKRDVVLGGSDGERRIVLSGLVPGDVVVTYGSAKVRQAETSGVAIPHGHTH